MRALRLALLMLVIFVPPALARGLSVQEVNTAELGHAQKVSRALKIKAQVLLDRAGFSSGEISGYQSENFTNALRGFQERNELEITGKLDPATWSKLASSDPVLIEYTISNADTQGPFADQIPTSYEEKAKLDRLDYTGPQERLAERFHMNEDLLEELNPGKQFDEPGTVILVANVNTKPVALTKLSKIEVDKKRHWVRALGSDGKLVAAYPASIGSKEKPAPSGTLKVVRVAKNPTYTYNPEFNFHGVKADHELKIAAGPNNPVGLVWIALDQKTYGIHGTAEPGKVGQVASHGCVRLTNWDALALAAMVKKGTPVVFLD